MKGGVGLTCLGGSVKGGVGLTCLGGSVKGRIGLTCLGGQCEGRDWPYMCHDQVIQGDGSCWRWAYICVMTSTRNLPGGEATPVSQAG